MSSIPMTMKAIRVNAPGGPEVLRLEDIPVPSPGPDQALVRLEAVGINFIDVYKRTGLYKIPLPSTLGEEGAGSVVSVGPNVSDLNPGDRVAWASVLGAYAEYAVIPVARLVPLPAKVTAAQAAAVILQGMTAHYLATSTYPIKPGDRCLIQAAAGGTGLLLTQVAKRQGGFVIGTAGSDEKAALAKAAGADEVIVYSRQDFVAEVKRITDGRGVNVIYDSVGKTTFLPGLDALLPRGMMVLFGASSGPVAPFDPQLLNQKGSLFLTRPTLAHHISTREELLRRAGDVFNWIAAGELDVRVGAEFPLADAASAHRALEARQTTGKVLLRV